MMETRLEKFNPRKAVILLKPSYLLSFRYMIEKTESGGLCKVVIYKGESIGL